MLRAQNIDPTRVSRDAHYSFFPLPKNRSPWYDLRGWVGVQSQLSVYPKIWLATKRHTHTHARTHASTHAHTHKASSILHFFKVLSDFENNKDNKESDIHIVDRACGLHCIQIQLGLHCIQIHFSLFFSWNVKLHLNTMQITQFILKFTVYPFLCCCFFIKGGNEMQGSSLSEWNVWVQIDFACVDMRAWTRVCIGTAPYHVLAHYA